VRLLTSERFRKSLVIIARERLVFSLSESGASFFSFLVLGGRDLLISVLHC